MDWHAGLSFKCIAAKRQRSRRLSLLAAEAICILWAYSAQTSLPIEIDNEEEYKLEEILKSKDSHVTLCYRMKYKGYSVKQSKWLPAENFAHEQDMVHKFHAFHQNQPKCVG